MSYGQFKADPNKVLAFDYTKMPGINEGMIKTFLLKFLPEGNDDDDDDDADVDTNANFFSYEDEEEKKSFKPVKTRPKKKVKNVSGRDHSVSLIR